VISGSGVGVGVGVGVGFVVLEPPPVLSPSSLSEQDMNIPPNKSALAARRAATFEIFFIFSSIYFLYEKMNLHDKIKILSCRIYRLYYSISREIVYCLEFVLFRIVEQKPLNRYSNRIF
jgi:hypothetical protein